MLALLSEAVYNNYIIDYTTSERKCQMRFYCPCCGEESDIELELVICPGGIEFVICPICGTMFKIIIQYTEVKNEP